MGTVWVVVGVGCLIAYIMRADVPSGSPMTLWVTFSAMFLGLGTGTLAGRWWPPSRVLESVVERFPRWSTTLFWLAFAGFGLWMLRGNPASGPWCLGAWFGYAVGAGTSSTGYQDARRHRPPVAARLAVSSLLVTVPFIGDSFVRATSLDVTDTVGDYREAHIEDVIRLHRRLCWGGECLTQQDWACGFDNGDTEVFDNCFDDLVRRSEPSVRLDDVRKYCGNRTMVFVGARYSTPERCRSEGGRWGMKSPTPRVF